jgi:hypothetical protein
MEANDLNKSKQENKDLNTVNSTESLESQNKPSVEQSEESNSESKNTTPDIDNKTTNQEIVNTNSNSAVDNEEQETEEGQKKPTLDKVDLSSYSKSKLVERLKYINNNFDVNDIKDEVEEIKSYFYKIHHTEVEELKQKFIASGEAEENFAPQIDTDEIELKELLQNYKKRRTDSIKKLEEEKENNLAAKYEVIEAIKHLSNRQESLNETFNEFRELQHRFHEIGPIPSNKVRDVWDTYNLHIENFYNYIKINKELRDLDLKKNLSLKLVLCENAEKLIDTDSVVNSFKSLQKYHDQWREIGPVPKEKKDEIWERFKAATTVINQKHQAYFEGLKEQLKDNLKRKTELCEKAEAIIVEEAHSPKEWEEKSKKLIELQKVWKTIGFAPKKDNNAIYERFRNACDKFFEHKRIFFKEYKNQQQENLKKKTELCEKAESMMNSTDWKKATDEFILIQKQWKEIGPVPRRQSDAIWTRFRKACDAYFDHKAKFFSNIDESQEENLKEKRALIEELKNLKNKEDNEETFKLLQNYQSRFSEIGHVPFKEKDKVNQEFRNEINKHFDNLNLDEYHKNVQKFRNKLENIKNSNHQDDKLNQERHKLITKLKQLEADIVVWENNIGFFAKSKSSDSLIKDFKHKIENGKRSIKLLQEKIDMLDHMDE